MQIVRVGLRNLRSYRNADVGFGPGTTLLAGDIGSGKTSLLYAVEMALFGFAEVDAGYLIRHGAKEAEVSLSLTDGHRVWEVRRRFARRSRKGKEAFEPTENSLAVDGHRAAYSSTELRRRTIELLGFPDNPNPRAHSDVWRWAVYLAQERMRDVLDPDADRRMETVRKALGVEQYRLAGENARSLARTLQERAANLAEQTGRHRGVEEEIGQWRESESTAQQQLGRLEIQERELRAELAQARTDFEEMDRQLREVETVRESLTHQEQLVGELDRSIQEEQSAIHRGRERLERLQSDLTRESEARSTATKGTPGSEALRTQREKLVRGLTELESVRAQVSGLEEQSTQSKVRESELETRHRTTLHELATVESERARLEATEPIEEPRPADRRAQMELAAERAQREEVRRGLDRQVASATAELEELAEIVRVGVCPRCHRPVEPVEFETHRSEQENVVVTLQGELTAAARAVETMDAAYLARLEHDRRHDRWDQLQLRRADLRQREAVIRAASAEEEAEHRRLITGRADLDARRQALAAGMSDEKRLHADLKRVDREILELGERARAVAVQEERMALLERQIPELEKEIELRVRAETERTARKKETLDQIQADRGRLHRSADVEARWKGGRRRLDELGSQVEDLLRAASGPRGKLAEATSRLHELSRRLIERRSLELQASQATGLSEWIDRDFRNAMLEFERRRLLHGRLQFERRFAQYFAELVEDPSLVARLDETFAPWVDIGGQATPAEALSGGERTALALAYRLALGRTVRDAGRLSLETLILDEPTEGFSQEQTLRMGDLLEALGLPQVILVSHERQLEGIADRVIRVRKKDGVSVIEEEDRGPDRATAATLAEETSAFAAPRTRARRRTTRRLPGLEVPGTETGVPQAK